MVEVLVARYLTHMDLPTDRMPEAEVSLRLAASLIEQGIATSDVEVSLDGAHIQLGGIVHFHIQDYIRLIGWRYSEGTDVETWRGVIVNEHFRHRIIVHSISGRGDVVASIKGGWTLRVEAKKGPLIRSSSSVEYPLMQSAIGQLMTVSTADATDMLAVAVPSSPKFEALAASWRTRPLMLKAGIKIVTVSRDGVIRGLTDGV